MKSLASFLLSSAFGITTLVSVPVAFAQSTDTGNSTEQTLLNTAEERAKTAAEPDFLKPVPENDIEMRDIDPALWVIRDEDTEIYLFGTVHILKPGLSWFDDAVKEAFDKSDTLVVEVIEPQAGEMQAIFAKYALASDGVPIRQRLTGDNLSNYLKAIKKVGLPATSLDPLDPWAIAVTLQLTGITAAGYDTSSGVETQLEAAAKASGKEIDQVETMEQQLGAFDKISMATQIDFLNQTTSSMDAAVGELDVLVDHWSKGDTEKLADIINAGFQDPELYNALLTNRNANWARWVKQRMDTPGTVFLAVGAGHLAGGVSLQNLLTAYRIEATRIDY